MFSLVKPVFLNLFRLQPTVCIRLWLIILFSLYPLKGLKLNLFIESFQYVPELSQTAGARIVIHNQGEMPFPDEEGINLVPGFSTSVGVRRVYTFFMLSIMIRNSRLYLFYNLTKFISISLFRDTSFLFHKGFMTIYSFSFTC